MSTHPPMYTSSSLRTASITLSGESQAMAACSRLVSSSQWFSVLPLPDDHWEITVKVENEARLRAWCAAAQEQ
ncbi:MAG: hypothetical protein J0L73_17130 [Verrucomicrobia bacterium]|nr:hypothetical protein [Verrucomicrobiota bacterium]